MSKLVAQLKKTVQQTGVQPGRLPIVDRMAVLWNQVSTKDGVELHYLSGQMGSLRLTLFPTKKKNNANSPDWYTYLQQRQTDAQKETNTQPPRIDFFSFWEREHPTTKEIYLTSIIVQPTLKDMGVAYDIVQIKGEKPANGPSWQMRIRALPKKPPEDSNTNTSSQTGSNSTVDEVTMFDQNSSETQTEGQDVSALLPEGEAGSEENSQEAVNGVPLPF